MIPVILPSCSEVPEYPLFLQGLHSVDYRKLDPDPEVQLMRALGREIHTTLAAQSVLYAQLLGITSPDTL